MNSHRVALSVPMPKLQRPMHAITIYEPKTHQRRCENIFKQLVEKLKQLQIRVRSLLASNFQIH
jgi:hypothetical protein